MARRRVTGEQVIPGAESLLQATIRDEGPIQREYHTYVALSVQVSGEGKVRIHHTSLDPGSGRIVTRLLDAFDAESGPAMSVHEMLNYWARESLTRSQEPLW
jgi:hypothetical protein